VGIRASRYCGLEPPLGLGQRRKLTELGMGGAKAEVEFGVF